MNSVKYLLINNHAFLVLEELESKLCSFKWDPHGDRTCRIVEYDQQIVALIYEYGSKYLASLIQIQNKISEIKKETHINKNIQKEKIEYNEYLIKKLTTHIRNQKIDNIIYNYEDTLILAC
jgi:hypothetical protein